jgi:hypothetical protein
MRDDHTLDTHCGAPDRGAKSAPREHATSTEAASSEATSVTYARQPCPCGFRGGSLNRAADFGRLVMRYGRWFLLGQHAPGFVCAVGLPRAEGEPSGFGKTDAEAIDLFVDAMRVRNAREWLLPGGV